MTRFAVTDVACWRVPLLVAGRHRAPIVAGVDRVDAVRRAMQVTGQMAHDVIVDGEPELIHPIGFHDPIATLRRNSDAQRRPW